MRTAASLAALSVILSLPAVAQQARDAGTFPNKPVRVIVPFPPGGGTEAFARMTAHGLTELWGQQVIVENRGGAGGTIGSGIAAKAAPDGYTLLVGLNGTHGIAQSLYRQIPYDTVNDFTPISMLAIGPNFLTVHPSLPVKTAKDLVALARANPGQLNFGSAGIGTPPHLQMEVFNKLSGAKIVHVAFQGGGPATIAIVSGQIQVAMTAISNGKPLVDAGKLKVLGLTGARRPASPLLANYPTIAESGVPKYDENTWYGLFAPAGLPPALLQKIHADVVQVLRRPEFNARFVPEGQTIVGNTPDEFRENVRTEVAKWRTLIREMGLQQL